MDSAVPTAMAVLEVSRHLGVNDDTAWPLHNKILRAMADWVEAYLLRGKFQIDDSCLGGELPGSKAGRGAENKIPIVAAVSLNEAGHPFQARITAVRGFSSEAIGAWAREHLAAGSQVLPRRLLLPLQPALCDGGDDQVHGPCGVLLQATIKTLIDPIVAPT